MRRYTRIILASLAALFLCAGMTLGKSGAMETWLLLFQTCKPTCPPRIVRKTL